MTIATLFTSPQGVCLSLQHLQDPNSYSRIVLEPALTYALMVEALTNALHSGITQPVFELTFYNKTVGERLRIVQLHHVEPGVEEAYGFELVSKISDTVEARFNVTKDELNVLIGEYVTLSRMVNEQYSSSYRPVLHREYRQIPNNSTSVSVRLETEMSMGPFQGSAEIAFDMVDGQPDSFRLKNNWHTFQLTAALTSHALSIQQIFTSIREFALNMNQQPFGADVLIPSTGEINFRVTFTDPEDVTDSKLRLNLPEESLMHITGRGMYGEVRISLTRNMAMSLVLNLNLL